jgi:uncharacterized protein
MKTNSNQNLIFGKSIWLALSILVVWGLVQDAHAQVSNAQPAANQRVTNSELSAIQTLAEHGDAKAQYDLAMHYGQGTGVEKNLAKAVQFLRQSADQGYADAEVMLGSLYGRGKGVPCNPSMAVEWYRKAAYQGNAFAQFAMGNFYSTGRGVTNDRAAAIQWWKKAASQNNVEAEAALGQFYLIPAVENGTNYLNYLEGLQWLHRAVAQGSANAMNDLGVAYETGLGVKIDFKEAARWYHAAAEQGNDQAQANLGQLYFDGRGLPLNLVQAYKWFKLSANQGNKLGIARFDNFEGSTSLLQPKQLAEAEQMVLDFHPSRPKTSHDP